MISKKTDFLGVMTVNTECDSKYIDCNNFNQHRASDT